MFEQFGINAGFVEELHARYQENPQEVEPEWRAIFEEQAAPKLEARPPSPSAPPSGAAALKKNGTQTASFARGRIERDTIELPPDSMSPTVLAAGVMQGRVYQLLNAYRVRGHQFAYIDPLGTPPDAAPELDLANFGLKPEHLDTFFPSAGIGGLGDQATLRRIIQHLRETYCRSIGVEFDFLEEREARRWLENRMESTGNRAGLDRTEVLRVLTKLTDAEIFEQFIHKNYVGAKRFSLEGAESMIAMLDLLIESAGSFGLEEIVIGMAHRGRLNVLANIMGKNVREIFAQFEDKNARLFLGGGDVKYHLGYSSNRVTASGAKVHLSLAFNPSHLEFVDPVVEGRVRAKQDRGKRRGVMPLLIHGDASFMGQGVVAETLNLERLAGYTTGGSVHLVVNNQIGFTTNPEDSRSTRYATDIARMLKVPVFHVNGEDPEAVIQVARLAMEYRSRFARDVVIDMYCYRRHGHNEGDEPRFTQPLMYALIDRKPTVRDVYVNRLVASSQMTHAEAARIATERRAVLEHGLEEARRGDYEAPPNAMGGVWAPYVGGPDSSVPEVDTGVDTKLLIELLEKVTAVPDGFHVHPKARRLLDHRRERVHKDGRLFWETAEALAFATLLYEGHPIRLSGQDARRGTFSHRHAVLYDTETGEPYTPLAHVLDGTDRPTARFEAWDSPLSEAGVLGFDYGYSLDAPEALVLWEAQFGDFANSGQVIIDQFIVSAEDKWLRLSGIVLLLPHGYEGAGPEHSSARLERWLQMAAEDNMQVCNPSTPAQFFHLLRRQVLRPWRKPLAVMTPKSLLRAPFATSHIDELSKGTFQRVIGDDLARFDPNGVKRILLTSGKVYYDLAKMREETNRKDVAIVRLEQYYPLSKALEHALEPYAKGTDLVWVQEEPRNMGASYYMLSSVRARLEGRFPLRVVSRPESASPATGSHASHELEQRMLVEQAFA
jgi:2-oxoglutarate dehydrogenase E1 component